MVDYEGMFIIKANLQNDAKKKLLEAIKSAVVRHGAEVKDCLEWGRRKLAYRIKKQVDGLYILMNFSMDSAKLVEAKKAYNLNEDILKYLITRK